MSPAAEHHYCFVLTRRALSAMLKETYLLMDSTPADIHPSSVLSDFEPLTLGQYPIFNKYPTFIVEYQSQERERIRQQEVEYLRERQEVRELHAEAVRQQAEFEAWYKQQELLLQGEEQCRRILQEEESKLEQQRARLAAMIREVKELNLMVSSRRRFLKHQQDQRRTQLKRLDDKIQRKMALRDQETAAAVQDLEVRQMELDAQKQQLAKEQERVSQMVRAEVDTRRCRAEIEDSTFQNLIQTDADISQKNKKMLEESLAEVGQMEVDADWQAEWDDVVAKQAKLEEERRVATTVNAQWRSLISQETEETEKHHGKLRKSLEDSLNHQKEERLRSPCSSRGLLHKTQSETTNISLISQSDDFIGFSLDRGRGELDSKKRELIQEIRELRMKFAARTRATDFISPSTSSVHSH